MLKTCVHVDEQIGIMMCPPACVGVMTTCLGPVGLTYTCILLCTQTEATQFRPGLILKEMTHFVQFQLSPYITFIIRLIQFTLFYFTMR